MLLYSVPSADEPAYRDELAALGVRVLLLAPSEPATLPEGWTYVGSGHVTEHLVQSSVGDAASRHAYVSGPPRLVHEVRRVLRRSGVRHVTSDAFAGY
ncbi:hypothetical protein [Frondihabitans sp. PAMC 28766]|uniref:hypothetical protein n=1 Tax=Frondihabitans sp. PAMC 28766 TaxID=1795630 RepID=UPI001EF71C13|nr:hypothetical protein [Frondihabitans sp. PAMC 28766]